MGQKIHPLSYRIGITKGWPVRWLFKRKDYKRILEEDETIRKVIKSKVEQAGIAGIEIERTGNNVRVLIKAARPGFIIGRGGKGIEELSRKLEAELRKLKKGKLLPLSINIEEIKRGEASAAYTAQQIAWDLEKRIPFRRTMKKYMDQMIQNKEVRGAKVFLSGRLDGKEIARRESLRKGELPLQTLRADIDYGEATAFTTYGTVGVKVWIYKGEIFTE